ncbi:MAG: hypothetical protein K2N28_10335 [Muribaculaceae bacterium]|nr:hypothetical protein [Muribaculaceae bacterium]
MKTKFSQLFVTGFMVIAMIMAGSPKSHSAVNWQFQVGGMLTRQYGTNGSFLEDDKLVKSTGHAFKGAILLQIPLGKTSPMWIETGLAYRNSYILSQAEDFSFKPKEFTYRDLDNDRIDGYQGISWRFPSRPCIS